MRHVIVMSGTYGCLPDWLSYDETKQGAAEQAAQVHELTSRQRNKLARDGFLARSMGITIDCDYIELSTCDCSDPEQHQS